MSFAPFASRTLRSSQIVLNGRVSSRLRSTCGESPPERFAAITPSPSHLSTGLSMSKRIRKAVFPVAGLGTRFLPATKAVPKEMLTVVDRPVVQHVVDEAREAGIEHFIFVTGRGKGAIEDHFDMAYELEDTLRRRNKTKEYEALMSDLPAAGATSFTRQQAPLGLGHAVWCARDIIGDEPFAVLLPDMITLPARAQKRALSRRGGRGLRKTWRQYHRGRGSEAGRDASIRHRRAWQGLRPDVRDHRHGREAAAGNGAQQFHHFRSLYSGAGNFRRCSKSMKKARAAKSSSPTP